MYLSGVNLRRHCRIIELSKTRWSKSQASCIRGKLLPYTKRPRTCCWGFKTSHIGDAKMQNDTQLRAVFYTKFNDSKRIFKLPVNDTVIFYILLLQAVNDLVTELEQANITCTATITFGENDYKEQLKTLKVK